MRNLYCAFRNFEGGNGRVVYLENISHAPSADREATSENTTKENNYKLLEALYKALKEEATKDGQNDDAYITRIINTAFDINIMQIHTPDAGNISENFNDEKFRNKLQYLIDSSYNYFGNVLEPVIAQNEFRGILDPLAVNARNTKEKEGALDSNRDDAAKKLLGLLSNILMQKLSDDYAENYNARKALKDTFNIDAPEHDGGIDESSENIDKIKKQFFDNFKDESDIANAGRHYEVMMADIIKTNLTGTSLAAISNRLPTEIANLIEHDKQKEKSNDSNDVKRLKSIIGSTNINNIDNLFIDLNDDEKRATALGTIIKLYGESNRNSDICKLSNEVLNLVGQSANLEEYIQKFKSLVQASGAKQAAMNEGSTTPKEKGNMKEKAATPQPLAAQKNANRPYAAPAPAEDTTAAPAENETADSRKADFSRTKINGIPDESLKTAVIKALFNDNPPLDLAKKSDAELNSAVLALQAKLVAASADSTPPPSAEAKNKINDMIKIEGGESGFQDGAFGDHTLEALKATIVPAAATAGDAPADAPAAALSGVPSSAPSAPAATPETTAKSDEIPVTETFSEKPRILDLIDPKNLTYQQLEIEIKGLFNKIGDGRYTNSEKDIQAISGKSVNIRTARDSNGALKTILVIGDKNTDGTYNTMSTNGVITKDFKTEWVNVDKLSQPQKVVTKEDEKLMKDFLTELYKTLTNPITTAKEKNEKEYKDSKHILDLQSDRESLSTLKMYGVESEHDTVNKYNKGEKLAAVSMTFVNGETFYEVLDKKGFRSYIELTDAEAAVINGTATDTTTAVAAPPLEVATTEPSPLKEIAKFHTIAYLPESLDTTNASADQLVKAINELTAKKTSGEYPFITLQLDQIEKNKIVKIPSAVKGGDPTVGLLVSKNSNEITYINEAGTKSSRPINGQAEATTTDAEQKEFLATLYKEMMKGRGQELQKNLEDAKNGRQIKLLGTATGHVMYLEENANQNANAQKYNYKAGTELSIIGKVERPSTYAKRDFYEVVDASGRRSYVELPKENVAVFEFEKKFTLDKVHLATSVDNLQERTLVKINKDIQELSIGSSETVKNGTLAFVDKITSDQITILTSDGKTAIIAKNAIGMAAEPDRAIALNQLRNAYSSDETTQLLLASKIGKLTEATTA